MSVKSLPLGADGNIEGVPPTVGVSEVVVAPPHTVEPPLYIVHDPENVPTVVTAFRLVRLHAPVLSELKVSMDAP